MDYSNDRISLSIFMPFYNEEKNIRKVVEGVIKYMQNHAAVSLYEIIMVNDGSKDGTKKEAEKLEIQYPQTRLVSHLENRGYGAALISGIKNSKLDYIFYMDGDGQFDISELNKFFPHIKRNPAIIGYRKNRKDSVIRKINAKAWNILNRIYYGLKIRDIDCAFKLFKRSLIGDLPLVSQGAVISTEILLRLKRNNVEFLEIPVNHLPREYGASTGGNIGVILKAFKEFAKLNRIISN